MGDLFAGIILGICIMSMYNIKKRIDMEAGRLCYKTSRDYGRLKELLDNGYEVVCFITYDRNRPKWGEDMSQHEVMMTTDVCTARRLGEGRLARYFVSCRGHALIEYWIVDFEYKYTFEEMLEKENIEFIEPTILMND